MKRRLSVAALVLLAPACCAAAAAGAPVRLQPRDSVMLSFPGAVAVSAVDPSIVEASMREGKVQLLALRAGDTRVTVVLPTGAETIAVHVDPKTPLLVFSAHQVSVGGGLETGRDSAQQGTDTALTAQFEDGERSTQLQVEAVPAPSPGTPAPTALPLAGSAMASPRPSPVLLAPGAPVRLQPRDSVMLSFPGAVAVFAVDAEVVEASTHDGKVELLARRAGDTLLTVVLPTGVETIAVHVDPTTPLLAVSAHRGGEGGGSLQTRYDSAQHRTDVQLNAQFEAGDRSTLLHVEAVHAPSIATPSHTALPFASITVESPGRSLVLLDHLVQESQLTLDGRVLRGVHVRDGALALHAGIASDQPFGHLILPSSGERALAASWRAPMGDMTFVPRLLWLPDSANAAPGVVALGVEHARADGSFSYRGELGWSGRPGAALDLDFNNGERQVWARGGIRPRGFAALSSSRPAGAYGDGAWTERFGKDTSASFSGSASRLQLATSEPVSVSGRVELRHQLADAWSVTGSAGIGRYRAAADQELRRRNIGLGAMYRGAGVGGSALVRHQATADSGGWGGRFSGNAAHAGWRGNFFVDVQQHAASLDLLLQDRPDLRRVLAELGLDGGDPEEVLRQLREQPALLATHGIVLGPLRVNPVRWQSGLDVSWQGAGAAQPRLGMRLNVDRAEGMTGARVNHFATLYASWRVLPGTELSLGFSRWQQAAPGLPLARENSVQVALRTTLSAPSWPAFASRAIAGQVVGEQESGPPQPLAGVEVVLDRSRRTSTDAAGRFVFEGPGSGQHRVEAMLPAAAGAMFSSPSMLSLPAGGEARFGIRFLSARLSGVVRNDAGAPIAGVRLRVGDGAAGSAVTDSSGTYRIAVPEGELSVQLDADSLPPGHDLAALPVRNVHPTRAQPATADFTVRAQRVVQGTLTGAGAAGAVITVETTGREIRADAQGRFLLRGLPGGAITLAVRTERGTSRHDLKLPEGPAFVRDLQLATP